MEGDCKIKKAIAGSSLGGNRMSEELLRQKNRGQMWLVQALLFRKLVRASIGHEPDRSECMGWFLDHKLPFTDLKLPEAYARLFNFVHRRQLHVQN